MKLKCRVFSPGAKVTVRTMTIDGELSTDSGPAKPNSSTIVQSQLMASQMQQQQQARNSHFMSPYDMDFDMNVSPLVPPPVTLSNAHSLFDIRFSQPGSTQAPPIQQQQPPPPTRPRIRSADFEQENPEWLR